MNSTKRFRLYHGTTLAYAESIIKNNFLIQPSPEDWLGTGVYFFVDGISSGAESAFEWARNSYPNDECCVVEVEIKVNSEDVFDLTSHLGLREYNNLRKTIIETDFDELNIRRDLTIKKRRDIRLDDKIITNKVMSKTTKKILIHNVYIKEKLQRDLILESSYPNSTVACVNDLEIIRNIKILKHNKAFKTDSQRSALLV
ncbi:TPA: hypothetical protein I7686_21265 [Vibrio vulnificus]|uniref:hypothetical protein n=1 Tax=Vibrio TaxID=662 RepID=UPI001A33017A|nr:MULTISPECIES: hypothetical protein [Vibrio]EJU9788320.1 hypothetical protein [Vibrio vulnificus]MCA3940780.1 hypothetical protein [Vibrio vulnificus]MCA3992973.1 hypothetical protein [Vibrio vulnificus]MCS0085184.1 hypothetical protein [Vibrio alginolyticus]HAS6373513.1 hypothetical protein [Vibrio vulnificus]